MYFAVVFVIFNNTHTHTSSVEHGANNKKSSKYGEKNGTHLKNAGAVAQQIHNIRLESIWNLVKRIEHCLKHVIFCTLFESKSETITPR